MIFGPPITFTPTQYNSVIVKAGDGYKSAPGIFYYSGWAEVPYRGGRIHVCEKVAVNIDNKLYMQRTEFYRAMGIEYATGETTFIIPSELVGTKDVVISGYSAYVSTLVQAELGISISNPLFAAGLAASSAAISFLISKNLSLEPGEYRVLHTVAQVYNYGLNAYEGLVTDEYYKVGIGPNGEQTLQFVTSNTRYIAPQEGGII